MFRIPDPELQISFSVALADIRQMYLQEALSETIKTLDITEIDKQLGEMVPKESLRDLAIHGLRGELIFPVPYILRANPRLLGYYRLLYGYSQKEFYTTATGVSRFKILESRGTISDALDADIDDLCMSLVDAGVMLLDGIGTGRVSSGFLDDLTLLTVGPQLRGGANVKKGAAGIVKVFDAIHEIVRTATVSATPNRIEIKNAAERKVLIEFAPDPDIIIREEMDSGTYRHLIAIEVKAGSDFSNIHNRLGEAEKSHQKARDDDYNECWTVVNVDRIDMVVARRESPSTSRFYRISDITSGVGAEFEDFRNRVISLTGIKSSPSGSI